MPSKGVSDGEDVAPGHRSRRGSSALSDPSGWGRSCWGYRMVRSDRDTRLQEPSELVPDVLLRLLPRRAGVVMPLAGVLPLPLMRIAVVRPTCSPCRAADGYSPLLINSNAWTGKLLNCVCAIELTLSYAA